MRALSLVTISSPRRARCRRERRRAPPARLRRRSHVSAALGGMPRLSLNSASGQVIVLTAARRYGPRMPASRHSSQVDKPLAQAPARPVPRTPRRRRKFSRSSRNQRSSTKAAAMQKQNVGGAAEAPSCPFAAVAAPMSCTAEFRLNAGQQAVVATLLGAGRQWSQPILGDCAVDVMAAAWRQRFDAQHDVFASISSSAIPKPEAAQRRARRACRRDRPMPS